MNAKYILHATSAGCAFLALFFLGRYTGKSSQDANGAMDAGVSNEESIEIEDSVSMPAID